jgi:hypothetical protein
VFDAKWAKRKGKTSDAGTKMQGSMRCKLLHINAATVSGEHARVIGKAERRNALVKGVVLSLIFLAP